MRGVEHMSHIEEKSYKAGKLKIKRPLGRPRHRRKDY
jgi:hypothetical protein